MLTCFYSVHIFHKLFFTKFFFYLLNYTMAYTHSRFQQCNVHSRYIQRTNALTKSLKSFYDEFELPSFSASKNKLVILFC